MIKKNKSRNQIITGVVLGAVILIIAIFGRVAGENLESENLSTQINAQFLKAGPIANWVEENQTSVGATSKDSTSKATSNIKTFEKNQSDLKTVSTFEKIFSGVTKGIGTKINGGSGGTSTNTGGFNLNTGSFNLNTSGGGSGISIQTDSFSLNAGGGNNSQPGCGESNCLVPPDAGEYKGIAVEVSLRQFLITWTNFFLKFLALIAMIALIYAGFLYVTAAGNDEQAGKAKKIISWVVIGIVVILLAYALVNTLITKGPTGSDL
jgi:hypothetical protein